MPDQFRLVSGRREGVRSSCVRRHVRSSTPNPPLGNTSTLVSFAHDLSLEFRFGSGSNLLFPRRSARSCRQGGQLRQHRGGLQGLEGGERNSWMGRLCAYPPSAAKRDRRCGWAVAAWWCPAGRRRKAGRDRDNIKITSVWLFPSRALKWPQPNPDFPFAAAAPCLKPCPVSELP